MVNCDVCGEPREEGMDCELCKARRRFPKANYAPRVGCKYCGGTGEKTKHPGFPCICIFVSHDLADFAAEGLAETARTIRKELNL